MGIETSDVVIIGAGVAGATTAFLLGQEGLGVTIVERDAVASHASGYAFGGLNPLDGSGIPDPLLSFSLYCYRLHQSLAPVLYELSGVDTQFCLRDRMVLAFDETERANVCRNLGWQEKMDEFAVKWIDGDEAKRIEPLVNPQCVGALLVQGSGAVDSYRHTLALVQAAEKFGVRLRHGEVCGLKQSGSRVTVEMLNGSLEAGAVVVASGPWSYQGTAWTGIPLPVTPLKGQILRLRLDSKPMTVTLGYGGSYAASKSDGLIWAGTTEEDAGFDDKITREGLEEVMGNLLKMAPSLLEAAVVQQTACLRPLCQDGLPLVGQLPGRDNIYICTGGGRKGILWSTGMGRAVADLLSRGVSDVPGLDSLDPGRFAR